jgi:hypothetical protein
VLGRTLEPQKDRKTVGWRQLGLSFSDKFHDLYSSQNSIKYYKIRENDISGHVARMGKMINTSRYLIAQFEGKRPRRRIILNWILNK